MNGKQFKMDKGTRFLVDTKYREEVLKLHQPENGCEMDTSNGEEDKDKGADSGVSSGSDEDISPPESPEYVRELGGLVEKGPENQFFKD